MSAKADYVVNNLTRPTGAATGGYVISLTSSTTPMALSQPKDPTLAQYTFFVSRRREDGRERFRLHMGYFETMQAAEEMLAIVRDVYPQAWAGEAPGKKLRANNPAVAAAPAAAATLAVATPSPAAATPAVVAPAVTAEPAPTPAPVEIVAAPTPARAPAPVAAAVEATPDPVPAPVAAKAEPHPFASTPRPSPKVEFEEPFELSDEPPRFDPAKVPTVHAPVASPPVDAAKPAPVKPAATKPAPPKAAAKPATKPVAKPAAAVAKAAAAKPAAAAPKAAAPAKPPAVAPKIAAKVSAPALQPVAQKPAVTAPVSAPAPVSAAAIAATAQTAPVARAAAPEPTVQMPVMPATPSLANMRQVIDELDDLSDTQTIRLLERHSPYRQGSTEANVDEAIRVIKPEDAQSMQAIKSEVKRNAPVLFAVQLDWSVTPFDMSKVSPLAIFNAYTLYTTEANRDGRTWYGLRLGFFSDAVSAKQVAYYVRSDFKTVSVVPVTTLEKERANDLNASRSGIHRAANIKEGPAPTPRSISSSNASGVFKLLDDDLPAAIAQDVDGETSPRFEKQSVATPVPKAPPPVPAALAPLPAPEPPKKASKSRKPGARGNGRRDASAHVHQETLHQTLEILGASTLEIANDHAGDTGVRHLHVKMDKKGSKFASLIERLSGKK
jgi:hypothetical protein